MLGEKPVVCQPCWDNIPVDLRVIPHWVVWSYTERAPGKWDKPPMQLNGFLASPNNPAHWTTFEKAKAAVLLKKFDGVGFVFTEDFVGIDLDKSIRGENYSQAVQDFLALDSYAEISPSGQGVKFWFRGSKPEWNRKIGDNEIYSKTRYFTVTGNMISQSNKIAKAEEAFERTVKKHYGNLYASPIVTTDFDSWAVPQYDIDKAREAMRLIPPSIAEDRSTWIAVGLAAKATSPSLKEDWIDWSATAPTKFVSREDCEKTWDSLKPRGDIGVGTLVMFAKGKSCGALYDLTQLQTTYSQMRPIVIADMLRKGEVGNLISAAKIGKSFLVADLAIACATGGTWLGKQVTQGKVLVLDFELHRETFSSRYSKVQQAKNQFVRQGMIDVALFRGTKTDLVQLEKIVVDLKTDEYSLVILDALYRVIPKGVSENDNAGMLQVYDALDHFAEWTGASWVVVHHSSKGDQSGKSTVDVGSGAGSINRAVDCVMAIREHEAPNHAVIDVKNRSFPSMEPFSVRWEYPLWHLANEVEPAIKQPTRGGRPKSELVKAKEMILEELINAGIPVPQSTVIEVAGIARETCRRLLSEMEDEGSVKRVENKGRVYWEWACDLF